MNKNMRDILLSIKPINFKEAVGIKDENDNAPLRERHFLITIVEELRKKAISLGYDFNTKNGFTYHFNSEYWKVMDESDISLMLKIAAKRMGLDKYQAEYYSFIEKLEKQFFSNILKIADPNNGSIKINLLNGTFDFGNNSKLRDFQKEDFLTYQLPFKYDAEAKSPIFNSYLDRVVPDKNSQLILAEYLGYVFTDNFKQQKCMLLYGGGANGKSVFFEIVKSLIGIDNVTGFSLRNLDTENCRALISNKLLNYSSEIDANINKETFKQLCSGEPLQARLKYKDSFMMDKYAKLIFNCNELPRDVEYSNAYFRRFLIIPFTQTIPEKEQDKDLASKIINNELSGVFNWVLDGLKRLESQGCFTESELVNATLNEFRLESDTVYHFQSYFGYKTTSDGKIGLQSLYNEYDQYCRNYGFRSLNIRRFRKRLEDLNIEIKRVAGGNVVGLTRDPSDNNISEENEPF